MKRRSISIRAHGRAPAAAGRDAGTRARLLEVAQQAFAERGFHGTTVRQVCRRARANVAAVNYHFGSKERLYLEALRAALAEAERHVDPPPPRDAPPIERLRAEVRRFGARILSPRPEWHVKLLLRELLEPTFALDAVVRDFMRPRFRALVEAIAPFRPGADRRELALSAMSVIGQLVYHRVAAPVAQKLLGVDGYSPELLGRIVDHVVRFTERSLAPPRARRDRRRRS